MAYFGRIFSSLYFYFILFIVILVSLSVLVLSFYKQNNLSQENNKTIVVLTYSTFLKEWGPGPIISEEFTKQTGIRIKWLEVSNAGMLVENLSHRRPEELPDVVLGMDFLTLADFRAQQKWRNHDIVVTNKTKDLPLEVFEPDFIPYNWSPMTFIFKRSKVQIPRRIDDLLADKYSNSLALQDPRTSSTGLYFLIWVLSLKGEAEGFNYLRQLKSSIRVVSPSWSAAYSLFQNNQVPMVFSFFTSTIYHYKNESDYTYQPVYFEDPHIYSIEYAGILQNCQACDEAKQFLKFLVSPVAQKTIMEKNYMLPVIDGIKNKTEFDFPEPIRLIEPKTYKEILKNKEKYIEQWESLNL